MQNKSHIALKARLAQCNSLEEVITLSRRVTNPFLNPNNEERDRGLTSTEEDQQVKRPQPQRWPTEPE
uniref:hypothetical protein n=1 Tax=Thaumasiovibrio occultus TaxID=1891184 RepID=UPI000B35B3EA|nr:hypothetical protein [Thaumasiovibrio occultus]